MLLPGLLYGLLACVTRCQLVDEHMIFGLSVNDLDEKFPTGLLDQQESRRVKFVAALGQDARVRLGLRRLELLRITQVHLLRVDGCFLGRSRMDHLDFCEVGLGASGIACVHA